MIPTFRPHLSYKRNSIPWIYCDTQGNVTHEQENILQGYKNDFELLYYVHIQYTGYIITCVGGPTVYENSKFDNHFPSSILEYFSERSG